MLHSFRSLLLTFASAAALHGSSAVLHAPSQALHASLAAAHAPQSIVQQYAGRMSKPAMCMSRRSFNSLLAGVLSAGVFNVPQPSKAEVAPSGVSIGELEDKMKELETARSLATRNGNYQEAEEEAEEEEAIDREIEELETEEAEEQMAIILMD